MDGADDCIDCDEAVALSSTPSLLRIAVCQAQWTPGSRAQQHSPAACDTSRRARGQRAGGRTQQRTEQQKATQEEGDEGQEEEEAGEGEEADEMDEGAADRTDNGEGEAADEDEADSADP